jgi:hypothetical protein
VVTVSTAERRRLARIVILATVTVIYVARDGTDLLQHNEQYCAYIFHPPQHDYQHNPA